MAQQIEIELKTMLTVDQFNLLRNSLPNEAKKITQINHYFETKDFQLKAYKSALRIREIGNHFELTLKEPHKDGILETSDFITKEHFRSWINGHPVQQTNVGKQLNQLQIDESSLLYFGSLTTERYTFTKENISYMLDKSMYNDMVDYELEIEATSIMSAQKAMKQLLTTFNIREKKAAPKIQRFFESKHKQ